MTRAAEIAAASAGPIVAGAALTADGSGALWWEAERLLIVADLHFEKGSAFAARRVFLPPYDTAATLARLAALVARYRPAGVVALSSRWRCGCRVYGLSTRAAKARSPRASDERKGPRNSTRGLRERPGNPLGHRRSQTACSQDARTALSGTALPGHRH